MLACMPGGLVIPELVLTGKFTNCSCVCITVHKLAETAHSIAQSNSVNLPSSHAVSQHNSDDVYWRGRSGSGKLRPQIGRPTLLEY